MVAQAELKDEDGDASRNEGECVWDKKSRPAVGVSHVGKAPDVAQADGAAYGSKEETTTGSPLFSAGAHLFRGSLQVLKVFLASKQALGMDGPQSWPALMASLGDKLFFTPAPGGLGMRNHTTADEYFQELWKMVANVLPYGLA
jgi:hypothetical protein